METFNVLLVDDEAEFLDPLVKRLKKRSINVRTAPNGEEALKAIQEHEDIDVAVLDIRMPGMDGIETLREIKKRAPLIEVIMLTGHANIEVAVKGMELGAFDYLMKPMNIDELYFKLQDAYQNRLINKEKMQRAKKG
jgi:DNA-binding NtrC family response regulator